MDLITTKAKGKDKLWQTHPRPSQGPRRAAMLLWAPLRGRNTRCSPAGVGFGGLAGGFCVGVWL